MQISTATGPYFATTTENYKPTSAELYYWYSGTHAGVCPTNPYAPKRMRVTRTVYRREESRIQPPRGKIE